MAKQRTDTESVLKLVINGQQAKASVKELQETYLKLNAEIKNMRKADDPRAYAEKATQVQKLKTAFLDTRREIEGTTKNVKSFNASFSDIAKGVFGGNMIMRAWDMAVSGVSKFISKNAELSDQMAGVSKTTGLTEAAVDRLNEKFKKLDTRTARTELLGLAQIAGKLGHSAEKDVEVFVRAADKIGVALGEDLGGTEEAIQSIGKLVDIFKISDTFGLEESLLKVGSAINELGSSGAAGEKYLIDFTQRMAAIAPAANISITDTLGLATTLDELGQSAESSSTAVGQFIVKMGADIPKFAKIAGLSVKDFSKLLRDDANEAFLRVLESSDSAGGGIQKLAENMGLIDVAGARGIAALGVLSGNVDKLREKQGVANKSFKEGTSILREFDSVNNTLGANLEKIQNRLSAYWENSSLKSWLTDITAKMVGTYSETNKLTKEFLDQKQVVANLESSLSPMIARYEELKEKGELSKDEQIEINKIINTITISIPEAATEFNKYGEAIGFSTTKAREFIESQKAMLKYKNQDAIKSAKSDLEEYSAQIDKFQRILKSGWTESELQEFFFGDPKMYKLNDKMRADYVNRLKEAGVLKKGAEELLKSLSGEDIVINKPDPTIEDEGGGGGGTPTGSTGNDPKKEKVTEAQKLQEELNKINEDIFLNSLEASDKEIEAIRLKYEKLRSQAKGNKDQLVQIDNLEAEEAIALQNKITLKTEEEAKKQFEAKAKAMQEINAALMTENQLELDTVKNTYQKLLDLADEFGLDKTEIIKKWIAAEGEIVAKQNLKEAEDKQRNSSRWKLTDAEYEEQKKDFQIQMAQEVANTTFDIFRNSNQQRLDSSVSRIEGEREKELSNKRLTEDQKAQINAKYDAKVRAEKIKAWKADQRAAIAQAIINGALAVTKVMAQTGILSPFAIPAIVAGTALQIGAIAAQKPPEYAKGGLLPKGSSHSQGGIDLWDKRRQKIVGNIEGGEPILSKTTYANNREIVDELLYSSQRKAGASIRLNPEILDAERMVRNGGSAMTGRNSTPVVNVSAPQVDFNPLLNKMDEVIVRIAGLEHLDVVFNDRAYQEYRAKKVKLQQSVNA